MAKRYERIEKSNGSYGIVRRDDGAWCADFRLTDAKGRKIGSVRYVNLTIGGAALSPFGTVALPGRTRASRCPDVLRSWRRSRTLLPACR